MSKSCVSIHNQCIVAWLAFFFRCIPAFEIIASLTQFFFSLLFLFFKIHFLQMEFFIRSENAFCMEMKNIWEHLSCCISCPGSGMWILCAKKACIPRPVCVCVCSCFDLTIALWIVSAKKTKHQFHGGENGNWLTLRVLRSVTHNTRRHGRYSEDAHITHTRTQGRNGENLV